MTTLDKNNTYESENFEFLFQSLESIDFVNSLHDDVFEVDSLSFLNDNLESGLVSLGEDASNSSSTSSPSSQTENFLVFSDSVSHTNESTTQSPEGLIIDPIDLAHSLMPLQNLCKIDSAISKGPISITLPEVENKGLKFTSEIILNFDQIENDATRILNDGISLLEQMTNDPIVSVSVGDGNSETCLDLSSDLEEMDENDDDLSPVSLHLF